MIGVGKMNKEEILERNKKSSSEDEDEREQYISGKAGINAKIVFSMIVAILAIYKHYKGMSPTDVWAIFMAYGATESLYKYYYLKDKKMLFSGILFTISSICCLLAFIFST